MRTRRRSKALFAYLGANQLSISGVAFIDLPSSPLAPGRSPVRIHYRVAGDSRADGSPIIVLHGGWGYEIYPYDRQIARLGGAHPFVIPDRSGYGASGSVDDLPTDFHHLAMEET